MAWTNNSINYTGMPANIAAATSSTIFTNKTIINSSNVIEERTTVTSTAAATPTGGSLRNFYSITAQVGSTDPSFQAPSGTPVDGNYLLIRFTDDNSGGGAGITFNAIYRFPPNPGSGQFFGNNVNTTPPPLIVNNKTWYMEFRYNSTNTTWDCISFVDGF